MHGPATDSFSAHASSKALPVAALLAGNAALAFGPVFVRMADTGPVSAGLWRIALATPLLLALATALGQRPVVQARGLWPVLALGGLAFAADLGSWHVGIHKTTLANATLFGNAATLIFPIYGFVVARAWPNRAQATALAMAAVGAALLMGRSAELSVDHLIGDLLCLAAGVLYAVYFITMARARTTMQPLPALACSSLAGVAPLLIGAWLLGERIVPTDWTPLVALALLSQVFGQGLMIYALGHLTPLLIGIALLLQPIVAAAIGWVAYHERLGAPDLIGATLVAAALVLVRRGSNPALARRSVDPKEVA